MQRFGIVDLGSNTARLVVYGYEPGRWYRLIDEIREPVRLGEGMGRKNRLTKAAIERTEAALELYVEFAAAIELDAPWVIATSAVRDAENSDEFHERIHHLGLAVDVLSGEEEAELGVIAAANAFPIDDAWVMDLGGGSAQISEMRGRRCAGGSSHPLGAVRLTEAHLAHDPPLPDEVEALERTVAGHLESVAAAMRKAPAPLVAMGGTIRNLTRAVQKRQSYPLGRVHGYALKRADLEALTDDLLTLKAGARGRIGGIHPDRADIILAGALVYRWLMRHAGVEEILLSGYGVREGAFLKRFLPSPHHVDDVRAFSVNNLFARHEQPRIHTDNVRRLARLLFDGLSSLHGLSSEDAEILEAAAVLHDIGMTIGYHNHHKHGAYLIESTRELMGFTHREQILLMLLVRYHRKGTPRWGPWSDLAGESDKKRLLDLATCLRLAEYLERGRAGRVEDVRVWITSEAVTLELIAAEEPSVEIVEAGKQAPLFEQTFGRRLVLKRSDGQTPA